MNDFDFSIDEKKTLVASLKSAFGIELGVDRNLKRQLSLKYQKNKVEIFNFLNTNQNDTFEIQSLKNITKIKSTYTINIVKKVRENTSNINFVIGSHIHMSMNRLFISKNRESEFVCYQMLFFYYESMIARTKYNNA